MTSIDFKDVYEHFLGPSPHSLSLQATVKKCAGQVHCKEKKMCFFSQKLLVNFKKRKEKKEMANTKFNKKSSSIKTAFFLVKSTLNLYLQLLIFFFQL